MGEPLVIHALVNKRAELAGELRAIEDRAAQLRADLVHLDATIRVFDPAFRPDGIEAKRRQPSDGWFANGEIARLVLEALRDASEPMTAREIVTAVMERRGLDTEDAGTVRVVEKRVEKALRRREGLLERVPLGLRAVGWKVAGS